MNQKKIKSIGITLLIIFLVSFFLSVGISGKNISVSAEEISKKDNASTVAEELSSEKEEDYVLQSISDIIALEKKSAENIILQPPNDSLKITSSPQEIINSILSKESFTINGEIDDGNKAETLNSFYNFSKISKFEIAEWIYDADLISEEQKIDIFCELILQRNFANTNCLEGVISEIYHYSKFAKGELAKKIESVLSTPFENSTSISTSSISNEATYSSTNFTVIYDANLVAVEFAGKVADDFELIRDEFIKLEFKTPILQRDCSTYRVYLDPDPKPNSSNTLAANFPVELNGNICASYIRIYNFTVDGYTKDYDRFFSTFVHEYFHAIQNAYNYQPTWFKETCATWSAIAIDRQLGKWYRYEWDWIQEFIGLYTGVSMPALGSEVGYAAVLLPLVIQRNYGGIKAIRSFYEAYSDYDIVDEDSYYSLVDLRDAINKGIKNNDYPSGSFDMAFRCMASYLAFPKDYFSDVVDTSNWVKVGMTDTWDITTTSYQEFTGSIDYLASKYFRITVPKGYTGGVRVNVTFSGGQGVVQTCTVDENRESFISFYNTTNEQVYAEKSDIGGDVKELTLIMCNLENSGKISFTAQVSLINHSSKISFLGSTRYEERQCYIPRGEYKEFPVTFETSGYKVIQTFGELDTKLELYSSSGILLASDDDSGYSQNALISYYTSANTSYTIRVKFISAIKRGETKLAITPAFADLTSGVYTLSKYEDISSVTSESYSVLSWADKNHTRMKRYIPFSSATYIFELESTFDNYIYVIDPRSANVLIKDVDYNDDGGSGRNAKLKKDLDAGVPYLMIYSAYNPSTSGSPDEIYIYINKHEHNYSSCTPNDVSTHRRTCDCGSYFDEGHNWINVGANKIRCLDCMLTYVGTIPGGGISSAGDVRR